MCDFFFFLPPDEALLCDYIIHICIQYNQIKNTQQQSTTEEHVQEFHYKMFCYLKVNYFFPTEAGVNEVE